MLIGTPRIGFSYVYGGISRVSVLVKPCLMTLRVRASVVVGGGHAGAARWHRAGRAPAREGSVHPVHGAHPACLNKTTENRDNGRIGYCAKLLSLA